MEKDLVSECLGVPTLKVEKERDGRGDFRIIVKNALTNRTIRSSSWGIASRRQLKGRPKDVCVFTGTKGRQQWGGTRGASSSIYTGGQGEKFFQDIIYLNTDGRDGSPKIRWG